MYVNLKELNGLAAAEPPCADDVRTQVDRICRSSDFIHAERLKSFLRFVVDEALAGRSDRLKAYAIALAVFDRTPSFDPQADPIVRIEASRLRRALEHHYLTEGQDDPVIVTIPKGSYVPLFEPRRCGADLRHAGATAPEPGVPSRSWAPGWVVGAAILSAALLAIAGAAILTRDNNKFIAAHNAEPVILVLPFSVSGDAEIGGIAAAGLTGALIDAFASSPNVRVMGRETTRWAQSQLSLPLLRENYGLTHILEGDVIARRDGISIAVRMVETKTNAVVWVKSYDRAGSTPLADLQGEISSRILMKLGLGGASPSELRKPAALESGGVEWSAYSCKLRFYQYRLELTPSNHGQIRQCLEDVVDRTPADAVAWAMLSLILIDDLRGAGSSGDAKTLIQERARQSARRAISLQPDNPRALEALSLSLYFSGQPVEGLAAGERAMALAPHDPEILGEIGPRIAHAGDWERGRALLVEATALNPGNAGYYAGHLAFIAYMQGDFASAANYIARTSRNQFPTRYLVEALIAAELGQSDRAESARAQFLALQPGFIPQIAEELARRNMTAGDGERLRRGLAKAGFTVSRAN
jgi:adenylate cyclase